MFIPENALWREFYICKYIYMHYVVFTFYKCILKNYTELR